MPAAQNLLTNAHYVHREHYVRRHCSRVFTLAHTFIHWHTIQKTQSERERNEKKSNRKS